MESPLIHLTSITSNPTLENSPHQIKMKVFLYTSIIPYSINKRAYFHFSPWYHTSTHSVIFNLNEIKLMLALILRSCP